MFLGLWYILKAMHYTVIQHLRALTVGGQKHAAGKKENLEFTKFCVSIPNSVEVSMEL